MIRSHVGVTYWCSCIPRVAWSYEPVFNAVKALCIIIASLKRKDDEDAWIRSKEHALLYANRAIRGLIQGNAPPEVYIILTTIFWHYEGLLGNWKACESHFDHGRSIASQAQKLQMSEPFMAQYVATLSEMLSRQGIRKRTQAMEEEERKQYHRDMRRYAPHFMIHALSSLRKFQRTIVAQDGALIGRTFPGVADAERQLCSVIASWVSQASTSKSELSTIEQIIKTQSPFIPVLEHLDRFLEDGDDTHLAEFECDFRPTLDQFMWLASVDSLESRQRWIEIQYQGRKPARLTNWQLKLVDDCAELEMTEA